MAVNGAGVATAVWLYESDGQNNVVQAATHSPGGSWSTPVDISSLGEDAEDPHVAVNPSGAAAAVWTRSDGSNTIVQVATKPAGGSWSTPVNLSAAGESADSPLVNVDPSGDVFVVWDRSDGSNDRLQAAVETAGVWGSTQTLSPSGVTANVYDLKTNASGTAVVAWQSDNTGTFTVDVATYTEGLGWGSPDSLGGGSTPAVTLDAAGDVTVAWEQRQMDEQFVIVSASMPAGGSWSTPTVVSAEGAGNPFAVSDASGNPVLAWDLLTSDSGGDYDVQASFNGAAAMTLDAVPTASAELDLSSLQSDGSGNVAALMIKYNFSGPSATATAEVSYHDFGASSWTSPVRIASYPGTDSYSSAIALEADQNGVATWEAESGGVSVIEAAISTNTTITSPPPPVTNQPDASIAFSSTEPNPSFRCSLDGGPFIACSSPATYTGLANGEHTFAVEATDGQGNVDLAPVLTSWEVDAPPVNLAPPTITGGATQGETLTESHGSWSNAPTSYAYQWEDCSPASGDCTAIADATSQTYTLGANDVGSTIRVVETASNTGGAGSGATSNATTTVAAESSATSSPGGGKSGAGGSQTSGSSAPNTHVVSERVSSKDHTARFRFTATGNATGFQCALVREPTRKGAKTPSPGYHECSSPKTYGHLEVGTYTFYVRARGPGGVDKTPAIFNFKLP